MKHEIIHTITELVTTALYYFAVWAAGMAFMNRYLGLW